MLESLERGWQSPAGVTVDGCSPGPVRVTFTLSLNYSHTDTHTHTDTDNGADTDTDTNILTHTHSAFPVCSCAPLKEAMVSCTLIVYLHWLINSLHIPARSSVAMISSLW